MIIVLFVIFLVAFIFFFLVDFPELAGGIGVCILGIIIAALILTGSLVGGRVIDEKIEMYTEENTAIEESVNTLVIEYMEFESDTFKDLKGDEAITLVSLYPELKSDELIKAQIELYQKNNAEIKSLRKSKLNLSAVKWWLYFGS